MPFISNSAEGLTNGTVPTPANTGGSSGTACAIVSQGTASTIVASSAASVFGSIGYRCNFVASSSDGACRLLWSFVESGRAVVSAYFRIDSVPSATEDLLGIRNSTGNMASLSIGPDGKLLAGNAAGGNIAASRAPNVLLANTVYRVELAAKKGVDTATGTIGISYYQGNSNVPLHTWESATQNTGTADIASVFVGRLTGRTQAHTIDFDQVRASTLTSGWLDPAVNSAPTAEAGPSQTGVSAGATVTLNGTASLDPDGDPITYTWSQLSGTTVTLSSSTATSPTFTAPSSPSGAVLVFQLTVSDGESIGTDTVTISILSSSVATPIRKNNFDFAAQGTIVTVANSGSSSNDPFDIIGGTPAIIADGMHSTGINTTANAESSVVRWNLTTTTAFSSRYYFRLIEAPSATMQLHILRNSSTTITGNNLTATSKITLVKNGGGAVYTSTTTLATNTWYRVAIWGTVATASTGVLHFRLYEVDATTPLESYDSATTDLGTVGVNNTLLGKPGSSGSVGLYVDDWAFADTASEISIATSNSAPVANAGTDQIVDPSTIVTLSGSSSYDSDGSIASYMWQQISGSTVTLNGSGAGRTFTAPAAEGSVLQFSLVVVDNNGTSSSADTMTVTVRAASTVVPIRKNNFEFAALGTVITAANSGDQDNNAFNIVTGSPVIASDGMFNTGANVTGNSTTASLVSWNSLSLMLFSSRYYVKLGSAPSVLAQLHTLRNGSTTITGNNLTTASKITLVRNGGATVYTSSTTLANGQWYRVSIWGTIATATTGELHFRLYDGDSDIPLESYDSTTIDLGTVPINNTILGKHTTSVTYASLAVDDWAIGDVAREIGVYSPASNIPPVVTLTSDKDTLYPGEVAHLEALATDIEDGSVVNSLIWASTVGTLEGEFINNKTFVAPPSLSDQTVTITVSATDSNGSTAVDTVDILLKASAQKMYNGSSWVPMARRRIVGS